MAYLYYYTYATDRMESFDKGKYNEGKSKIIADNIVEDS
jgi:hypothetical protein